MQLMDENYLDAYELIDNPDPNVREFVGNLPLNLGRGLPSDEWYREDAAKRVGKILENLPVQNLTIQQILGLNNLDNMPEDPYTLQALKEVSGKEGYREMFIQEMQKRDKRDYREREFPLEPILEAIENRTCRPPLILELKSGQYVIDGRTRLYAALASNWELDAKVVNTETFGGLNDEN